MSNFNLFKISSPRLETLKKNKKQLTDEERAKVKELKAEWSNGDSAVFKSEVDGKTYFVTNTHRAYQVRNSIEAAAKIFHDFIKSTAKAKRMTCFAQNVTETPEFKAWFGNSKVVKKDGTPRRVFHGTASPDEFNLSNFKTPAFFTSSPGESNMYSTGILETQDRWKGPRITYDPAVHDLSVDQIKEYNDSSRQDIAERIMEERREGNDVRDRIYNDGFDLWKLSNPDEFYGGEFIEPKLALISGAALDWKYDDTPPRIIPYEKEQRARTIPVYLKIENPFHMEAKAASLLENFSPHALETIEKLKKQGYDGIFADSDFALALHYVAFYPEQIGSALSFQATNKNWYKFASRRAYQVRDSIEFYDNEPKLSNEFIEKIKRIYPLAKKTVDGRVVRDYVPNLESIRATMNFPIELPGIREVRTIPDDSPSSKDPDILELAEQIRQNGEIDPLIVVIDNKNGLYILEGAHRIDALYVLDAKSFPAVVVIDPEGFTEMDQNMEMGELLSFLQEDLIPDPSGILEEQGDFLQSFSSSNWYKTAWGDPVPDLSEELYEKIEFGDIDSYQQLMELLRIEGIEADLIKFHDGEEIVVYGPENDRQIINLYNNEIKSFNEWIYDISDSDFYGYLGDIPEENFWDGVGEGFVVYHGTSGERLEDIKKNGLEARCESRGISNKNTGCGVFTSTNIYDTELYGLTIEINVGAMKQDRYMPEAGGEEPLDEEKMRGALAHKMGAYYIEGGDLSSDGLSEDTIVFYGDIPPKYLTFPEITESKGEKQ